MNATAISLLKNQLRKRAREQRQSLSNSQLEESERQLTLNYQHYFAGTDYRKIAIPLQHDNELGTKQLIQLLLDEGCQVYVPKLHPDGSNRLQFARYFTDSTMQNNRFGIPEPLTDQIISITDLELIFLPLTAFDLQGNRLGMGGGFYDRTLAKSSNKTTLTVGLAYDFQQCSDCPVESFDQPLQMVLTPTRCIDFKSFKVT